MEHNKENLTKRLLDLGYWGEGEIESFLDLTMDDELMENMRSDLAYEGHDILYGDVEKYHDEVAKIDLISQATPDSDAEDFEKKESFKGFDIYESNYGDKYLYFSNNSFQELDELIAKAFLGEDDKLDLGLDISVHQGLPYYVIQLDEDYLEKYVEYLMNIHNEKVIGTNDYNKSMIELKTELTNLEGMDNLSNKYTDFRFTIEREYQAFFGLDEHDWDIHKDLEDKILLEIAYKDAIVDPNAEQDNLKENGNSVDEDLVAQEAASLNDDGNEIQEQSAGMKIN